MINNLTVLIFAMGWQGGTITQVAQALKIEAATIIAASEDDMGDLLRVAQAYRRMNDFVRIGKYSLSRTLGDEPGMVFIQKNGAPGAAYKTDFIERFLDNHLGV
jgi:hypothetical protein